MAHVLCFWKPYGVLTRFTDASGRPTLAEFIDVRNVYPVGRLDADSEGLLLLTDDGVLSARLTQPRFAHPRTYWAQVEYIPGEEVLERLRAGIVIQGQKTRSAQVQLIAEPDLPERPVPIRVRRSISTAWIELTLTEGRNRQVRRMTAAVGHPTLRLIRVRIGSITLAGLEPGQWRTLSSDELRALRKTLGLR